MRQPDSKEVVPYRRGGGTGDGQVDDDGSAESLVDGRNWHAEILA